MANHCLRNTAYPGPRASLFAKRAGEVVVRAFRREVYLQMHSKNAVRRATSFGPFRLLPRERVLEKEGVPIQIGGRAFDILVALAERAGEVISNLFIRGYCLVAPRPSCPRFGDVERSARIISQDWFGSAIAHEVYQPLTGVAINAEACLLWLNRETPNLDEARRSVEWIIKDCNRASEMIRHVRALSKMADTQKAPLDINDVINEVITLVQRELNGHRVSLRMELAPALPVVIADRIQLQQMIMNLVMNGIEAMQSVADRPRQLVIQSRQDETKQLLVSVTDCGVGISAENADRLFNAFFTTKSTGMGMGLSICRSIIEAHGGRLWAEPNLPQGATFHFTLPSHQEDRVRRCKGPANSFERRPLSMKIACSSEHFP
jgi:signal transduction histidine kinase